MKKIIGLLGKSLKHSFSKQYFTNKFKTENLGDYKYINICLEDITDFTNLINKYPNLIGLNVTIPYKESVLQYVDFQDDIVSKIGAANTLKIYKNNKIAAYNTDVIGFAESIKPILNKTHKHALILGSGGASKAVKYALEQLQISSTIVSRKPIHCDEISYAQLTKNIVQNHQIVVNTTPLGMYPKQDTYPDFPYDFIGENHIFYDLVYNPKQTIFLEKAQQKGAKTTNGLEMLHLQAEAAWKIWIKKNLDD